MKFSRFARFGMFGFTSRKTVAERIYAAMVKNSGGVYDLSSGSMMEAKLYAWAMMLARSQVQMERAESQADPYDAWDLFKQLEANFGVSPYAGQPLADRRLELWLKMRIAQGPTESNIVAGLKRIIGTANFIAYRTVQKSEVETWPPVPGLASAISPSVFKAPLSRRKISKLVTSVSKLGAPVTVELEDYFGDSTPFQVGEYVVFEPGRLGLHERVKVEAATTTTLTATFSKAHGVNQYVSAGPYPFWLSNQKHSLVIVAAGVVNDVVMRRRINHFMSGIMRGNSTWSIVKATGANTAGPFKHGEESIGITTLGTVTF